jgi:methylmalonyl-CoA mutase C-terminal domain/subunit
MNMERRIRVLLAKPTHDCHDRGVRYLARKLSDAGMEVVFANFLLPAEVVNLALQESVDVVGISVSAGGHMPVFRDVIAGLAEHGMDDVLLIGGGVIPPADVRALKSEGVAEVFGPGATAEAAIELVRASVN